jgi:amidohydrolase
MRPSTALGWIALFSTTASGLPFTRGKKEQDEDKKETATAVIEENDVISISVPSHRRNAAVDYFLADPANEQASELLWQEVKQLTANQTDFLVSTRRTLHRKPELMYQEEETSAVVQRILRELDIPFTSGWAVNQNPDVFEGPGGYGIVADIGTGQPPCVLLRADMDALPIFERTENVDDFRSENDGKMHACGHDAHVSMLLGAAAVLKSVEASLPGTVRLIVQAAEEGGAGGKRMREEGILEMEPRPQHAFGMHVWPTLPSGSIASRPGPLLAAAERFEVLIAGVGGHAAMPHLTIDPIVTASAIVMNLQTIVSRSISPLESGVCSITMVEAGEAFNIIPASALLRGTVRALSTETLLSLRNRVQHIVETTAATYGCNVTIS